MYSHALQNLSDRKKAAGVDCSVLIRCRSMARFQWNIPAEQMRFRQRCKCLTFDKHATDIHGRALRLSEDARHCAVRGISADPDANQAVEGGQASGIEKDPAAPQMTLEDRVKIRRIELVCVSRNVPRRNVERPAQGDT